MKDISKTKEFIIKLLKDSKLTIEYFDIYYAKKIHPDMFGILKDNLETFTKIVSIYKEEKNYKFLINEQSKNLSGFSSVKDDLIFYTQNNKTLDKIFQKSGNTLMDLMESYGISKDLLTYTSRTSYESQEKNSRTENSGSDKYDKGKDFEYISLERFNYSITNLKNNLICLTPLPNIIFYLIPLDKMKELKKLINVTNKKEIRDKLKYKTDHCGYNELDGIYMNDINLERKINNFKNYKIIKFYKINNKNIEEFDCEEGVIRPYSINFIEVKSSFNKLKEKEQIISFLKKCITFIFIFKDLKINKLDIPKLYDDKADKKDFPKDFCYDLFFIVNQNEKNIDKHLEEIKNQINKFIKKEDFNFNFQLFLSSKKLFDNELNAIYNCKLIDTNSMLFNYNKLNYYYENRDKELKNEINNLKNQLSKYNKFNKRNDLIILTFIFLFIYLIIIKK